MQTLEGHQAAVWAVVGYVDANRELTVITASADKTIKQWRAGKCIRTIAGHQDVVRGLVMLPERAGFASCANDG